MLARRDFSEPGFRYIDGYYHRLQTEVNLAYSLAAKGRPAEALDSIRQGSAICNAASHYREAVFWGRSASGRIHLIHSYLAFAARRIDEAAEAADRAEAVYEKVVEPTRLETWDLAAMHLIWFMEGRREIGPSRRAPGRPEHAAQAISLLRRAAERGFRMLEATLGLFGPVLGHMPEFQALIMDLSFPTDPFEPMPEPEDDRPLPPSAGAIP